MQDVEFQSCSPDSQHWMALERLFQTEWSDFRFCDSYKPDANLPPAIIALKDNRVIGGLAYSRFQEPHQSHQVIWFNALYVLPHWRGAGIAGELVNQGVGQVPKSSQSRVYAYTNVACLYQSLGWSVVNIESEPNHHVMFIDL
ncbi:acetyltransferase [Vibrio galatheae]|uniref:Acetyltransferase n=1 Tax=Vibrio galatheae TaxID=579748 RepID=A0A0F4NPH4_9VIBR|nr:GNAT family N-acetyltransferase [Vibrio galatheae]KJY83981.1 acetyltransferase [Vibrio galatheae]